MVDTTSAPLPRLPAWVWIAVLGLTLLAFGWVIRGYLSTEDFYFVPRLLHVPLGDTLRGEWLKDPAIGDPQGFLQFYRPLGRTWLHIKLWLTRGWLPALRLDQLVLNAAVSLSAGILAIRWTQDRTLGVMTALFSVAGPGHLRIMTSVWGAKNLWAALAGLWTVIWLCDAVARQSRGRLAAGLGASVVGVLWYEQVLLVPFGALVIAAVLRAGSSRRLVPPLVATVAVMAGYGAVRWHFVGGLGGYTTVEGESWIALDNWVHLAAQAWETQWNVLLSVATPLQPPLFAAPAWLDVLTLALWTGLLVATWRRAPERGVTIACALIWIVSTTVPLLGRVAQPNTSDTYPFLAALGTAILCALVVRTLLPSRGQWATTGAIILLHVSITWRGAAIWMDTWDETRRFVSELREQVPESETPAFAYVEHLPGARPEPGQFSFLAPPDHDAYTGYLPARLFLRRTPVAWPNAYPVSGTRDWAPAADVQLHWLRWDVDARTLTRVPAVPSPARGTPVSWSFAEPAHARAWRPAFQLVRVPGAGSPPAYVTDGPQPLFVGPRLPPTLGTPIYAELHMQIAAPEGGRGIAEWHFRTADTPDPSPAHVIRFWVEQDGTVHGYRVPLVNNPNLVLHGPPTQLDLRPTTTAGATVRLLSLTLVPQPVLREQ